MITDSLATLFRSERLIYRAFQNDDKDRAFCYEQITSDPVNYALSDPGLLAPRSRKAEDAMMDELAKSLLAVIICLPPPENEQQPAGEKADADAAAVAVPKAEPTPIGFMCLSWGGFPPKYLHHHRATELGITMAAAHQGRGYGGEAVAWALDWAFRFANMHSVTLGCIEYNTRAQRTYERAGFVLEGR